MIGTKRKRKVKFIGSDSGSTACDIMHVNLYNAESNKLKLCQGQLQGHTNCKQVM